MFSFKQCFFFLFIVTRAVEIYIHILVYSVVICTGLKSQEATRIVGAYLYSLGCVNQRSLANNGLLSCINRTAPMTCVMDDIK